MFKVIVNSRDIKFLFDCFYVGVFLSFYVRYTVFGFFFFGSFWDSYGFFSGRCWLFRVVIVLLEGVLRVSMYFCFFIWLLGMGSGFGIVLG